MVASLSIAGPNMVCDEVEDVDPGEWENTILLFYAWSSSYRSGQRVFGQRASRSDVFISTFGIFEKAGQDNWSQRPG
jgi:hypothetical protein